MSFNQTIMKTTVNEIMEMFSTMASEKKDEGRFIRRDNYCTYRKETFWNFFNNLGITEEDLNSLNVIHVAGSKGKGSTCTFIESILRENGIKTGLYTSPHLLSATERIRIDGKPIMGEKFVEIFQKSWSGKGESICRKCDFDSVYFVLFSIAIKAFIDEGVEVAIIEVGKGGEYDVTNIITKPVVCGITLLEIEHSNLLGDDIRSIAWHKSGIFKPGSKAFTIPQEETAREVLIKRADERECELSNVAELSYYVTEWKMNFELGLRGKHQSINAALAIEVCLCWMEKMEKIKSENVLEKVKAKVVSGLKKASILGRNQIIKKLGITYCLDVAHTCASLQNALEWFNDYSSQKEKIITGKVHRILAVSIKKEKIFDKLFPFMSNGAYDHVVFPVCYSVNDHPRKRSLYQEMAEDVEKSWKMNDPDRSEDSYRKFESVEDAVTWIEGERYEENDRESFGEEIIDSLKKMNHVFVFVTGSFKVVREFIIALSN